jgi:hypothetical protein
MQDRPLQNPVDFLEVDLFVVLIVGKKIPAF